MSLRFCGHTGLPVEAATPGRFPAPCSVGRHCPGKPPGRGDMGGISGCTSVRGIRSKRRKCSWGTPSAPGAGAPNGYSLRLGRGLGSSTAHHHEKCLWPAFLSAPQSRASAVRNVSDPGASCTYLLDSTRFCGVSCNIRANDLGGTEAQIPSQPQGHSFSWLQGFVSRCGARLVWGTLPWLLIRAAAQRLRGTGPWAFLSLLWNMCRSGLSSPLFLAQFLY